MPKFIEDLRQREVAPHVSEYVEGNLGKNSLTEKELADERRSISQRKRKLIERVFGWSKLDRLLRQVKLRGLDRVDWFYRLTIVVHNLVRMRRLIPIESLAEVCLGAGKNGFQAHNEEKKPRQNGPRTAKNPLRRQNEV
jgi:hypothetical protein